MKILRDQSFEYLGTPRNLKEAWEFAEKAYRTCYQSQPPKDSSISSEEWCRRFIKHNADPDKDHMSPLEFGVVYLTIDPQEFNEGIYIVNNYIENKYSRVRANTKDPKNTNYYITTSLRVILENHWEDDLIYATSPREFHEIFHIFSMHTCMHTYKDCRTHRTLSWAVESTRTCNYNKEKFGSELTFILLPKIKDKYSNEELFIDETGHIDYDKFINSDLPEDLKIYIGGMHDVEERYIKLVRDFSWQPQEAAEKLSQDLAGHAMFGGYFDNLCHFFNLRALGTTGSAHPMVEDIMIKIYDLWKTKI